MYQVDLCRYYRQKEAYESGEPIPDISASEALELYEAQLKSGLPLKGRKVGKAPTPATAPTVLEDIESEPPTDDEEEDESPEPPKAATPPKSDRVSKRQKTAKESEAAKPAALKVLEKAVPAKAAGATKTTDRVSKSPEIERKKKALKKGKADEEAEEEETEATASSPAKGKAQDKKDKKKKSKRKGDTAADE